MLECTVPEKLVGPSINGMLYGTPMGSTFFAEDMENGGKLPSWHVSKSQGPEDGEWISQDENATSTGHPWSPLKREG